MTAARRDAHRPARASLGLTIGTGCLIGAGKLAVSLAYLPCHVRDPRHEWTQIRSGLEDVFISLMDTARDNFS